MQRYNLRKVATIPYRANSVVREQIPISGLVRSLYLVLSGTVTVSDATGAAAITRNPGSLVPSISAFLDRAVLWKQGRWLDFIDRMRYFSDKTPPETASGATATAHAFVSRIRLNAVAPWSRSPIDTALYLDQVNGFQRLDLEVQWGDPSSLVYSGTKSFTTEPSIDVIADVLVPDPRAMPWGLYVEGAFDSAALGTAANTNLNLQLIYGPRYDYHHLFLVAEDAVANTGRALVSTALNEVKLQQQGAGEVSNVIGPLSGSQLQYEVDELGHNISGVATGIYPMVFPPRYDGLATYALRTADLTDLRFLINHAAFTTNGYLRTLWGMVQPLKG